MKIAKEVFEAVIKEGCVTEWFGLSAYFDVGKFVEVAERRGLIGDVWDNKAKELLLTTYRTYALRNQIKEDIIDKDLKLIAEKLSFDLNELRRLYYFGLEEPKKPTTEKPTKDKPAKETPEKPSEEEIEKALEDVEGDEE